MSSIMRVLGAELRQSWSLPIEPLHSPAQSLCFHEICSFCLILFVRQDLNVYFRLTSNLPSSYLRLMNEPLCLIFFLIKHKVLICNLGWSQIHMSHASHVWDLLSAEIPEVHHSLCLRGSKIMEEIFFLNKAKAQT